MVERWRMGCEKEYVGMKGMWYGQLVEMKGEGGRRWVGDYGGMQGQGQCVGLKGVEGGEGVRRIWYGLDSDYIR